MQSTYRTFWITISVLAVIWSLSGEFGHSPKTSPAISLKNKDLPVVFTPDEVDRPALLINKEEIANEIGYPKVAWQNGIQGTIILNVLVDENGGYLDHRVVRGFHPILRIPCERYVPFLVFTPALLDGKPVRSWVEVPFIFSLP